MNFIAYLSYRLSKDSEPVFQELRKLQQIPLNSTMTFLSTRRPLIEEGFPTLASLIHRRQLTSRPTGPSAMLGPQIPEESLRLEAFDYGDDEEEVTQPTIATVNETSPTLPSLPHVADLKVTILQGDPNLLNSLQPDASVNFAQDDKAPLVSPAFSNLGDKTSLLEEDKALSELVNAGGLQDNLAIAAITFPPNTHTHATTPAGDCHTRTHGHNLQPTQDEPITPTKTFYTGGASIHGLELAPENLLDSSTNETSIPPLQDYSDLADPDLPAHCHGTPDTRSSSPTLSYVDEEDRLPIITRRPNLTTEPPSQSTSEGSSEEAGIHEAHEIDSPRYLNFSEDPHNSLTSNGNHESTESCRSSLQLSRSSSTSFVEPTPHSTNADNQNVVASTDKTLEDPLGEVISSPSSFGNPTGLEDQHDVESEGVPQPEYLQDTDDLNERSDVDMSIPTSIHGSTITLSMTILPIIPMTPANSPVFEGLSQYMTSHDSDTPGVISQETSGVGPDKSTSENGLTSTSLEPSDKSNLNPEPDIDIPIQPGPPLPAPPLPDSDSGFASGNVKRRSFVLPTHADGTFNVVPIFFALSRETINGQHHGASLRP